MSSANGTTAEAEAAGLPPGVTPPSGAGGRFLSDVIVGLGFAGRETVDQALDASRAPGKKLGTTLVEMGALTERQLGRAVAERYRLDFLDLAEFEIDPEAVHVIGDAEMRRYDAVPVAFTEDGALVVAMIDPADWLAAEEMAQMTGRRIRRAVAAPSEVMELMKRVAEAREGGGEDGANGSGNDAASMPARLTLRPVTRPLAGRALGREFGLERTADAADLDGGSSQSSESAPAEPTTSGEATQGAPSDGVGSPTDSSISAHDETVGENDDESVDEATEPTAPAPSDEPAAGSDDHVEDSAAATGYWSPATAATADPLGEEAVTPAPEAASEPSVAEPTGEPADDKNDEQPAFGNEPPHEAEDTDAAPKLVFSSIVRDDESVQPEQHAAPAKTGQDAAPSFTPWTAPVDTSDDTVAEADATATEPSTPDDVSSPAEPAEPADADQPLHLPEPSPSANAPNPGELEGLRSDLARAREELEESREALAQTRDELEGVRGELATLSGRHDSALERASEAERLLAEASAQSGRLEAELAAAKEQAAALRDDLSWARGQIEQKNEREDEALAELRGHIEAMQGLRPVEPPAPEGRPPGVLPKPAAEPAVDGQPDQGSPTLTANGAAPAAASPPATHPGPAINGAPARRSTDVPPSLTAASQPSPNGNASTDPGDDPGTTKARGLKRLIAAVRRL